MPKFSKNKRFFISFFNQIPGHFTILNLVSGAMYQIQGGTKGQISECAKFFNILVR